MKRIKKILSIVERSTMKIKELKDNHLSHYSKEIQEKYMYDYVQQFQGIQVICTCNRCLKGILLGKGNGIHLLDLVMI